MRREEKWRENSNRISISIDPSLSRDHRPSSDWPDWPVPASHCKRAIVWPANDSRTIQTDSQPVSRMEMMANCYNRHDKNCICKTKKKKKMKRRMSRSFAYWKREAFGGLMLWLGKGGEKRGARLLIPLIQVDLNNESYNYETWWKR